MDDPLPPQLAAKFTRAQLAEAEAWWSELSTTSKTEIIVLLDTRKDGRGYVYSVDENGQRNWQTIPIEIEPVPVHDHDEDKFWVDELIHYRLDHDDFVMASDMKECTIRAFGVCSQHDSAKKVIADGKISKPFRCSNEDPNCPIQNFANKFRVGVMLDYDPGTGRSIWLTR